MGASSKSTFSTNYENTSGTFADNSTREISESDLRGFASAIKESTLFYVDDYDHYIKGTTASGTDTYTIADTIPAAYTSGERFLVTFTNANTGAATLNRNSLGAKNILTQSGAALTAGQIAAGGTYLLRYNGTEYRVLNGPAAGGLGGSTGATDNAVLRADGTGGSTIQNSQLLIDDAGDLTVGTDSDTTRVINAGSSGSNATITITAKGTGSSQLVASSATIQATNSGASIAATSGNIIISNSSGDTQISKTSAQTVTTATALSAIHTTSGTAAAGFGVKFDLISETGSGNSRVGSYVESILSTATDGSEDFGMFLGTMSGGATAAPRLAMLGKRTTLTESTATTFATILVPTGTGVGLEYQVTVFASDGTDFQVRHERGVVTAVNKGGTLTIGGPNDIGQSVSQSSGTLSLTITAVDGGSGALQLKADATSSLIQTTLVCQSIITKNFGSTISS